MDDARRVRLGETVGDLHGDVEKPLGRERVSRRQDLAKGLPLHELHRDVDRPVGFADVVDGQDVGVVQGRGRARLLLEALATIGIVGRGGRQHLDRYIAAEPGIGRAIDLPHPAGADRGGDAVLGEATADHSVITQASSSAGNRTWNGIRRRSDSTARTVRTRAATPRLRNPLRPPRRPAVDDEIQVRYLAVGVSAERHLHVPAFGEKLVLRLRE